MKNSILNNDSKRLTAFVRCNGTCNKSQNKFQYFGVKDCVEAFSFYGGEKACDNGCLGFGSCAKACKYNAISIINGVAVVNKEMCKACGECVKACPKGLIEFIPYDNTHAVACNSHQIGKEVKAVCDAGCIGCMKCQNNCPVDAIHVVDNLARIDFDKCVICNACFELCPTKCIK